MALQARILPVLAVSFIVARGGDAFAQPAPDPSLWNVVLNPSGQRVVPVVFFDPATRVLSIDTRGLDRVSNTNGNTGVIGGDDVGMISLLVGHCEVSATPISPFNQSFDPATGIGWSTFNGSCLIGNPVLGHYILPGVYPVFQMTFDDLNDPTAELAINFGPGIPFGILTGRVQIVPEPQCVLALILTAICWRRYGHHRMQTSSFQPRS